MKVVAEESLDVVGEQMWDGCNDQGTNDALPPLTDQPVIWRQSGTEVELVRVDADPTTGRAKATVTVPVTALPGETELQVGTSSTSATVIVRPSG